MTDNYPTEEKIINSLTEEESADETAAKNKKYKKTITAILIGIVVLFAVIMAARFVLGLKKELVDDRPVVELTSPEIRDIEVYTEQIGTVMPAEYVSVTPMISGEILSIDFNIGDEVKEGDLLCTINYDGLEGLKISMDSAKMTMDDAQKALERVEALVPTGAVSDSSLEQTRSAAEGAKLAYDAAKLQYDLYMDYSNVKAPISGVIESKNVNVHDFSNPQTPICVISCEGDATVSFGLSEDSAGSVKAGDAITVEVGGLTLAGNVTEIGTMVSSNGLHQAKATVKDGGQLTTGSKVKVTVIKEKAEDALTIPQSAIYYAGSNPFVYVLNGTAAVKKNFVAGVYDEEYIQIVEGIESDDKIICTWDSELFDGAEVIVK